MKVSCADNLRVVSGGLGIVWSLQLSSLKNGFHLRGHETVGPVTSNKLKKRSVFFGGFHAITSFATYILGNKVDFTRTRKDTRKEGEHLDWKPLEGDKLYLYVSPWIVNVCSGCVDSTSTIAEVIIWAACVPIPITNHNPGNSGQTSRSSHYRICCRQGG